MRIFADEGSERVLSSLGEGPIDSAARTGFAALQKVNTLRVGGSLAQV